MSVLARSARWMRPSSSTQARSDTAQRFLDVLLHHQDRLAALRQTAHHGKHLIDDPRRQPDRRLVQHDDLGIHHQSAGDLEHALLAPGQARGILRLAAGEHRKHRLHRRDAFGRATGSSEMR